MAFFPVFLSGANSTRQGTSLVDLAEQLSRVVGDIERHFESQTQQLSGDGSQTAHYDIIAREYGFTSDRSTLDNATAEGSYAETNALIGNGFPSVKQWCARHKQ